MDKKKIYVVVLAGGKGTRFWPESVEKKPKQYLEFMGDKTLIGETLDRYSPFVLEENKFVVTVKEQKQLVKENTSLNDRSIILEPTGRNTAPCIFLSLLYLKQMNIPSDAMVIFAPSDHLILNRSAFVQTVEKAIYLSSLSQKIVIFGVPPHKPHTGYGYIERGKIYQEYGFNVQSFKEKPDLQTAMHYLSSGNYFWNSGMFLAPMKTWLNEFEQYSPDIFLHRGKIEEVINDFGALTEAYNKMPSISIDYAIMEKSSDILLVPSEFDWNDLGSWSAFEDIYSQKDDNTLLDSDYYYFENSKGNIIKVGDPDKFVALIDVNDHVVVNNDKSLMIIPKSKPEKVKSIISHLKTKDWGKDYL